MDDIVSQVRAALERYDTARSPEEKSILLCDVKRDAVDWLRGLLAEIERLEAQHEPGTLEALLDGVYAALPEKCRVMSCPPGEHVAALARENEALREALGKYGEHKFTCHKNECSDPVYNVPCDCGLDDALRSGEERKEEE